MTKKSKGHDKQRALLLLRLEFMEVDNMDHATLGEMRDTVRTIEHPYRSFMGWVIGTKRLDEWNAYVKAKKKGSSKDKSALNDKAAKRKLTSNEQEVIDIQRLGYG